MGLTRQRLYTTYFKYIKELKETRSKGLKESMTMMSDQIETINKETEIIKKEQNKNSVAKK